MVEEYDALLARLAEAESEEQNSTFWYEEALARLAEAQEEQHRLAGVAHQHYHECLRLVEERDRLKDAAEALHDDVEMAESIGICLPNRVASLRLGEVLGTLRAAGGVLE